MMKYRTISGSVSQLLNIFIRTRPTYMLKTQIIWEFISNKLPGLFLGTWKFEICQILGVCVCVSVHVLAVAERLDCINIPSQYFSWLAFRETLKMDDKTLLCCVFLISSISFPFLLKFLFSLACFKDLRQMVTFSYSFLAFFSSQFIYFLQFLSFF